MANATIPLKIPAKDAALILNSLLEYDRLAVSHLMNAEIICSEEFATESEAVCSRSALHYFTTPLGVINSLVDGTLARHLDNQGVIIKFVVFSE